MFRMITTFGSLFLIGYLTRRYWQGSLGFGGSHGDVGGQVTDRSDSSNVSQPLTATMSEMADRRVG